MENLTKENFFNEIEARYPKAIKAFSEWIDEYKNSVIWEVLFNHNPHFYQTKQHAEINASSNWQAPKFHDLPYELQVGIIMRFISETVAGEAGKVFKELYTFELIQTFRETFDWIEKGKVDVTDLQEQDLKDIKEKGIGHNG
jgi:hypothetical protein